MKFPFYAYISYQCFIVISHVLSYYRFVSLPLIIPPFLWLKVKSVPLYSISRDSGSRSVNWFPFEGSQGSSLHHTMWTTEKWQASTGGLLHITLPSSLQLVLAWRLCRSLGCEGRIRPDDIEIWAVKGWTWVDDIEIWALEGLNLNKLYRNLGCKGVNLSIWYQNLGCEGMNLSRWYRNSGCSG